MKEFKEKILNILSTCNYGGNDYLADQILALIPQPPPTLTAEDIEKIIKDKFEELEIDESIIAVSEVSYFLAQALTSKIAKEGEEIHRFDKVIRRMLEECKLQNKQSATLTMENVGTT